MGISIKQWCWCPTMYAIIIQDESLCNSNTFQFYQFWLHHSTRIPEQQWYLLQPHQIMIVSVNRNACATVIYCYSTITVSNVAISTRHLLNC